MPVKIVWGITGSGDLLQEVTNQMEELSSKKKIEITTCLSKAANMVVAWYRLKGRIKKISKSYLVELDSNTPFIAGPLQVGKYSSFLVAPATANTVAKIVHGIADTLITNAVAQAQKGGTPVIILPSDQKNREKITILPEGKKMKINIRKIDILNINKLKNINNIKVLQSPEDIKKIYDISDK